MAVFQLKQVENAEKELRGLPHQNRALFQELAERHVLQPFRDFMEQYRDLLDLADGA